MLEVRPVWRKTPEPRAGKNQQPSARRKRAMEPMGRARMSYLMSCGARERRAVLVSLSHALRFVCAQPITGGRAQRWRAAQEAESALWAGAAGRAGSDRNVHHAELFDGYRALPDALGHVVEVGCGPFTQLQSVLRPSSTTSSITLVDPLVHKYKAKARACAYRSGQLLGRPVSLVGMQLEAFVPTKPADVLVMIAVLQSVQDVAAALQAAYNSLRPGGWLVFADRVFDGGCEEEEKNKEDRFFVVVRRRRRRRVDGYKEDVGRRRDDDAAAGA